MNINLPAPFRLARLAALDSTMHPQVGAVMLFGKHFVRGYNKNKTHPKYANPEKHERLSLHAELDCLNNSPLSAIDELYVYRELNGLPAMARPCNHCMNFIREVGVEKLYYTIPHEPWYEMEEL